MENNCIFCFLACGLRQSPCIDSIEDDGMPKATSAPRKQAKCFDKVAVSKSVAQSLPEHVSGAGAERKPERSGTKNRLSGNGAVSGLLKNQRSGARSGRPLSGNGAGAA